MKILFVCGAGYVYGKEIITLSLMRALRERGHDVRCIISSWAHDDYDRRLEAEAIPFISLPLGFISKTLTLSAQRMTIDTLSKSPRLWLGYRRYLKEFEPDVVVHSTLHHIFHLWPVLDGRNTFFHVHDPFTPTRFYRRIFQMLSRRVRAYIGVSHFIERSIVALGVAPEKVFSVLNGVRPPENIDQTPETSPDAAEIVAPANGHAATTPVRVGIVGQVGEWKGHDDFVESLKGLKQSNLPFNAVIFGEGPHEYVAALKKRIADYQLTGQVEWAGFVKNQREIFSRIDICVVPSRSQDPCPTVAIETAHFGVPVIATRRGGLPEIVQDGKTGYLVDAASPVQLSEKLSLLIRDSELRQRMSRDARAYGSTHLTGTRMAEQMEAIFLDATGQQR
ncbi:MAG TPA: glycosyltransferase family 4 protein [Pyrinomonadaceae bacterium]